MSNNIVICPLSVPVSRSSNFILNLNRYRNCHFQTLNKAKKAFFDAVIDQVRLLSGWNTVSVRFTFYPRSIVKYDLTNVLCIHDKFLLDALVTQGKLPDDNYKRVKKVTYLFGCVDRDNPRVEAEFIDEDI